MRYHRFLIAVLAASVLLAGLMLIPRSDEHLTMLTRDGRYEEAARMLAAMRAQGDMRPELLTQQMTIHIKQGDVPRALEASRIYIEARPADVGALEIHAELLLHAGLLDEHLAASERLVRLRPEPERVRRLLAELRLGGHLDRELALLRHFAGSRALRLEHYERLGGLLAARGDWQSAARWLRHVDRHAQAEESQSRLKLLHVLLQSGQSAEALERAQAWLVSWRNSYLAGRLILTLAQQGGDAVALPLAQRLADAMPDAVIEVAGVLTQDGQAGLSREMLSRWIDRTPAPTATEARDYVHAALTAGEFRKPLQKLMSLMRAGTQPEVVAAFVEEIAHAYGPHTLAHLMPYLPRQALHMRPLLAADLALAAGNPTLTRWYLDRVDFKRLSDLQQDRWLELIRQIEPSSSVLERLLPLWDKQILPRRFAAAIAAEARAAGRPAVHDAVWASLRH